VNPYVFPLWAELLLQPFLVVIGMASALAGADARSRPARKLLDSISTVVGFVILFAVARHLVQHHDDVDVRATLLSFTLLVVLSGAVVSLTHLVVLLSSYEVASLCIGWGQPSRRALAG